jgi:hypothetical protein
MSYNIFGKSHKYADVQTYGTASTIFEVGTLLRGLKADGVRKVYAIGFDLDGAMTGICSIDDNFRSDTASGRAATEAGECEGLSVAR